MDPQNIIYVSAEEYLRLCALEETAPEPNAALLAAARAYGADVESGKITTYMDDPDFDVNALAQRFMPVKQPVADTPEN